MCVETRRKIHMLNELRCGAQNVHIFDFALGGVVI